LAAPVVAQEEPRPRSEHKYAPWARFFLGYNRSCQHAYQRVHDAKQQDPWRHHPRYGLLWPEELSPWRCERAVWRQFRQTVVRFDRSGTPSRSAQHQRQRAGERWFL